MTSVDTSIDSQATSPQHSPQPSNSPQNGNAPQSARQRLAKVAAPLVGLIGAATSAVTASTSGDDVENGLSIKELEDQLMGLRIREADAIAELKEMRQKVMELETQVWAETRII